LGKIADVPPPHPRAATAALAPAESALYKAGVIAAPDPTASALHVPAAGARDARMT
jgi:hypothetical protein